MPAFTFEKISPPDRRTPNAPPEKKPRGVIGHVLDRFSTARDKPDPREKHDNSARRKPKA